MSETTGAAEPSMEEILASIRQIINQNDKPEDEVAVEAIAAPVAPAAPEPEPLADTAPEDEEVLELTTILEEEPTKPEVPEPVVFAAVEPAPTPPPVPVAAAPVETLITGTTAAAATAALSSLASTLHMERAEHSLPLGNNTRTLESMVVEAIKPLLKEWLDANLPAIVERVVTAEVEKLTKRIGG